MADIMNSLMITQTAATLLDAMDIEKGKDMADKNECVIRQMNARFRGEKADRLLLYNPDAVALWLYQKYTDLFMPAIEVSSMALPLFSVMPSVTPVCFASMYTGLMPEKHGIRKYEKPVLACETMFDVLIRSGKKVAIVCTDGDSISRIFLERQMDYFFYDTVDEVNRKAEELINQDAHDVIVIYNGNYDSTMHKNGPEAEISLKQIELNAEAYRHFVNLAKEKWTRHNTLFGFMPDHGCHEIDGDCGSHGLDMAEDMNIIHLYGFIEKKK